MLKTATPVSRSRLSSSAWIAMTVLASIIALYAALVFAGRIAPPFVAELRRTVRWAVTAHLLGGFFALVLGPWQFNSRLRGRAIAVHRWMGRGYVVAVFTSGAAALVLAPRSQEGLVTHVGFGLLAALWLFSTLRAYVAIRRREIVLHRRWMIRSFALTLAAVTLRVWLPLQLAAGIPFHDAYQVVAWLCWVPNLVVAEWIVLRVTSPTAPAAIPY